TPPPPPSPPPRRRSGRDDITSKKNDGPRTFTTLTKNLCREKYDKIPGRDPSRGSYALSWKPCQGDSLNLPDHRYIADVAASLQRSQIHNIKLNVKSLFGEIVSPMKSQVKLKSQIKAHNQDHKA
nr:hypothetical protein [Tanacetum cinerariifolium]